MLFGKALSDHETLIILVNDITLEVIANREVQITFFIGVFSDFGISIKLTAKIHDNVVLIDRYNRSFDDIALFKFCCVLKGFFEHSKIFFFQFFHCSFAAVFTHLV